MLGCHGCTDAGIGGSVSVCGIVEAIADGKFAMPLSDPAAKDRTAGRTLPAADVLICGVGGFAGPGPTDGSSVSISYVCPSSVST